MRKPGSTETHFGRSWSAALAILVILFAVAAALNMMQMHVVFLTTHAADLSGPAILYIQTRKSWQQGSKRLFTRLLGRSPEVCAGVLFLVCAATEVSQLFYPQGVFRGRFDPLDLAAFALSVGVCYVLEKMGIGMKSMKQSASDGAKENPT